jgi:hypothetical protein
MYVVLFSFSLSFHLHFSFSTSFPSLKHLEKEEDALDIIILTTLSTARSPNHPNKQRRNRKRVTPPLSLSHSNIPLLSHQHPLPFPHLSQLSTFNAILSSRRHNRYRILSLGSSGCFTPNRLYSLQSRITRFPHLPPRRNTPNGRIFRVPRRCGYENDTSQARTAKHGDVFNA